MTDPDDNGQDKNEDEHLIGQMRRAFLEILAVEEFPGTPVKYIIKKLDEIESRSEAGQ